MPESEIPDLSSVASPPPTDIDYTEIELLEEIGGGGQAVVHRARIHGDAPVDTVAVRAPPRTFKSIKTGYDKDTIQSFFNKATEWQTVARREREDPRWDDSDHVVGVVDIGEEVPWIAMEYMDGGDLGERLDGLGRSFGLEEALWTAEGICRGIEVAHNEVDAHLDLKPTNVLFRRTEAGFWDVPKVADWGAARSLKDESGSIDVFSPMYASPEILSPSEFGNPGTSSDVYQLGATIYALLAGQPPYQGDSRNVMFEIVSEEVPPPPSSHVSGVPEVLDEAVLGALERHPGDRYESVAEFRVALEGIRTDGPLPPTLAKRVEDTSPKGRGQSTTPSKFDNDRDVTNEPSEVDNTDESLKESTTGDGLLALVDRTSSLESGPIPDDLEAQIPYLVRALTDADRKTRRRSALVLVHLVDVDPSVLVDHVDELAAVIDPERDRSDDDRVKKRVALMLVTLAEDHDVTPAVETCGRLLRTEGIEKVRKRAALTLLRQSLNHDPAPTAACVEELVAALDDPLQKVRNRASFVLIELASLDSRHLTPYREELERSKSNDSERVSTRVKSICEQLPDEKATLSSAQSEHGAGGTGGETDPLSRTQNTVEYSALHDWPMFGVSPARTAQHPNAEGPTDSVSVKWAFKTAHSVHSSPAVVDGTVYVGSRDLNVYAVDAATGDPQWVFGTHLEVNSSPAVVDGTVYVGSNDGNVYALDATTGDQQWAFETGSRVGSSPAVVDDTVYIGSDDHNVYALDATTGDQQWAFETGGRVGSSPAVVDDTVYIGSDDHNVYALEEK